MAANQSYFLRYIANFIYVLILFSQMNHVIPNSCMLFVLVQKAFESESESCSVLSNSL